MHCKHCGNQIENDSKFCSFCGGKIDPIGQTIPTQQPLTQVQNENVLTQQSEKPSYTSSSNDNGYLIAGIYFFTIQLIWVLFSKFVEGWYEYRYVTASINIVFMGLPILFALYTKKKEHKTILLIIGLILIGWTVYENFIKSA